MSFLLSLLSHKSEFFLVFKYNFPFGLSTLADLISKLEASLILIFGTDSSISD